jgi:threonine synthase
MVKRAFLDADITNHKQLTSANSINVARWLPQLFYFMFTYKQLHNQYKDLVFSVPSGNFGNICAGMMAQQLGLPIRHFVAANNENNVVSNYLHTQDYTPKPSVQTISNAMDVGNPSNFIRIQEIYKSDFSALKSNLSGFSFTDEETREAMKEIYTKYTYVADPHGAVGYLGCKSYLKQNPSAHCVFLETAHPTKFLDVVEETIKKSIPLPKQIEAIMDKDKSSIKIASYNELKEYLLMS